jgi:hypothetical protein
MKHSLPKRRWRRGVSLVETMVAIGVLALVGPLAVAALLKSGEGGAAARAETRSAVIVEQCLAELKNARSGGSQHLPALQPGMAFGGNEVLCLAFGRDGSLIGRVSGAEYDAGHGRSGNQDVSYLARLEGSLDSQRTGYPPLLTVTLSIEYPAVAPGDRRRRMEFHTKLP